MKTSELCRERWSFQVRRKYMKLLWVFLKISARPSRFSVQKSIVKSAGNRTVKAVQENEIESDNQPNPQSSEEKSPPQPSQSQYESKSLKNYTNLKFFSKNFLFLSPASSRFYRLFKTIKKEIDSENDSWKPSFAVKFMSLEFCLLCFALLFLILHHKYQ